MKKEREIIDFDKYGTELEVRKDKERTRRFKICLICGERKSFLHFSVDRRASDGRLGVCKVCRAVQSLQYYYANREEIKIRFKEYSKTHQQDRTIYFQKYQEDHKAHLKKIASKWYEKNKRRIKKRNLEYYKNNKGHCQAIRKLWIKGHKEEIKKYNREYQKLRK